MVAKFQSAPAITGGRSSCRIHWDRGRSGFNPRPPLLAGDLEPKDDARAAGKFQSAPAITGGRSGCATKYATRNRKFQSAPAITGGRSVRPASRGFPSGGFNPRPPLLAGDPLLFTVRVSSVRFQSAPAITGGRSPGTAIQPRRGGRFNPRPPLLAGDRVPPRSITGLTRSFNPRPPLLAGDRFIAEALLCQCFFLIEREPLFRPLDGQK